MALQCLGMELVLDMSEHVCEPCRGNGSKEHRTSVCHLVCVKLGDSATTHGKVQQAFEDNAASRAEAFHWHKMFLKAEPLLKSHSGQPSATRTGDNTA
jgi:hypothetical protein